MEIDRLVGELLSRGDMNDETVADLNRMLEAWRAGNLDADDESYLRGFHARIFEMPLAEPEGVPQAAARIDGLTLEEWRDRALRAEAELARLSEIAESP